MILEIIQKLKSKELTCEELILQHLKQINLHNKNLNAFITITQKQAIADAKECDRLINTSSDLDLLFKQKPLLGIPIGLKDIFSTKNIETTAGSNILRGYVPPYDATVVEKFKEAGAIIIGKLNCDAFAHGGSGENSDFGPTKNPYNFEHVAGGSSSGSGASVVAKMVMIATGTDTGGSIRNPASFTNTVGLKPTYGAVSRYGIIAMASSFDSIGHITKTVEDSAYVFNITAGLDPKDATTSERKTTDYLANLKKGIKGLKIGIPKEYFTDSLDSEVKELTVAAIEKFRELGAEIVDVSLPHTEYALATYYILVPSEISSNLGRFDGIRFGHSREAFGDEAKRRIMIGTYALSSGYYDAYYLKAAKVRTLITQDFKKAFEKVDVLLTSVAPVIPPKIGENVNDPLKMYLMDILSVTANLAGIPGLAVPAGFSKSGLPVGIQLLGKHFDETTLFRAGYAFEQATNYFKKEPKL